MYVHSPPEYFERLPCQIDLTGKVLQTGAATAKQEDDAIMVPMALPEGVTNPPVPRMLLARIIINRCLSIAQFFVIAGYFGPSHVMPSQGALIGANGSAVSTTSLLTNKMCDKH